jgi:hypothetical protein
VNPAPSLQLGIVVAVYPQGQSIDVLLPDSGSRLTNIQVMMASGSDTTGTVDLPDPGLPTDDTRWSYALTAKRNIIAVLASYKGIPMCIGFIMPQVGQMTFAQKNRRIMRHASDVYSSIDQYGNIEVAHPSGTYIRIGTSPAHEDLTGKDFDGEWKIGANTATAPYLNVSIANGGVLQAQLQIDPQGNTTLAATTTTVVSAGGITLNGVLIDEIGNIYTPANVGVGTGATGTFSTPTGQTVDVQDGVVTNIY